MLTARSPSWAQFAPCSLKPLYVSCMQTRGWGSVGRMGLGPPRLLGRPWPCQTCRQVPCNPGAAVIHVYLSISLWPECFFSDSKCPEALWRLPTPRPTIYHLSLLEVRRNQTPLPRCPGRPQHKLTALRFLCSFPRHWHHLLRFFFSFSASAFNFLFPLTSVFSAFFHSFLFSVRIPPPLLCFWFLVTRFPDSFLFRNPCLGPASFQSFWSFFLTAWSLTFIPFPTLRYHLLEPLKSSGGVSPGPAVLCRGNKSTGWCFQCDDCESDRLSPVLFWTSAHGPGSRLWLIVTILFQLFSICRPYCG